MSFVEFALSIFFGVSPPSDRADASRGRRAVTGRIFLVVALCIPVATGACGRRGAPTPLAYGAPCVTGCAIAVPGDVVE